MVTRGLHNLGLCSVLIYILLAVMAIDRPLSALSNHLKRILFQSTDLYVFFMYSKSYLQLFHMLVFDIHVLVLVVVKKPGIYVPIQKRDATYH